MNTRSFCRWLLTGLAVLALAVSTLSAGAQTIVETTFVSFGGDRHNLNGTMVGLTTNLPGGNWISGAGWTYDGVPVEPFLTASWDPPGLPTDTVLLAEERTVLALSIADSGGYTKPDMFNVTGTMQYLPGYSGNTFGVGFYSSVPPRVNGTEPTVGYSGILIDALGNVTIYINGVAQAGAGSSINVGALSPSTYYEISYNVDLTTGGISDFMIDGVVYAGLSTTGFTDAGAEYVGVFAGTGSRAWLQSLSVTTVPEPATIGMAATGLGLVLIGRRRKLA